METDVLCLSQEYAVQWKCVTNFLGVFLPNRVPVIHHWDEGVSNFLYVYCKQQFSDAVRKKKVTMRRKDACLR